MFSPFRAGLFLCCVCGLPSLALPVITGSVVDTAGVPLAGVTVSVSGATAVSATTFSDGQFRLELPKPGQYSWTASKAGCTIQPGKREYFFLVENPNPIRAVAFCGPGTYTRTVLYDQTDPVAGMVRLNPSLESIDLEVGPDGLLEMVLPEGYYSIAIPRCNYLQTEPVRGIQISSHNVESCSDGAIQLSGRISRPDGTSPGAVKIKTTGSFEGDAFATSEGKYSFNVLLNLQADFQPVFYLTPEVTGQSCLFEPTRRTVRARNRRSELDFLLLRCGLRISGRLLTDLGKPIPDARITIAEDPTLAFYSQPDGTYNLDGLPSGRSYTITASRAGCQFGQSRISGVVTANVTEIDFRADCRFNVEGTVNIGYYKAPPIVRPMPNVSVTLAGDTPRTEVTGPDGKYLFAGVPAGFIYKLKVDKPGCFFPSPTFLLWSHYSLPGLTGCGGSDSSGTVISLQGRGVDGAVVTAVHLETGTPIYSTVSDAAGYFFLPSVFNGSTGLTIEKSGCTSVEAIGAPGGVPGGMFPIVVCDGIQVGTVAPSAGLGRETVITAVFHHGDGGTQHYLGYLLFLPTPNVVSYTAKGSCLIEYNRISTGVRLVNDAGNDWLGPLEGVPSGSPVVLKNRACSVDVRQFNAIVNRTSMRYTAAVLLEDTLGPQIPIFLQGFDVHGKFTGMTQVGNWTLQGATSTLPGPKLGSFSRFENVYTIDVTHANGPKALSMVNFLSADQIVGGWGPCHAIYFPQEDAFNLVADDHASLVLSTNLKVGSTTAIENKRCKLSMPAGSVSAIPGGIRVSATMSLKNDSGLRPVYRDPTERFWVNVFDTVGQLTHWVRFF